MTTRKTAKPARKRTVKLPTKTAKTAPAPKPASLPPQTSEDSAFAILELDLTLFETHRRLAALFQSWCAWFTLGPVPTAEWFAEVWNYLPVRRWSMGRIQSYLFFHNDKRVQQINEGQGLLTDPEAILWLGNPNSKLTIAERDSAFVWLKKRWKEGEYVRRDALSRQYRRARPMQPKLYFEEKSADVKIVAYILRPQKTNEDLQKEVQRIVASKCKRSTVELAESGNYSENRPSFGRDSK